jgi:hypothetical protein
MRLQCAPNLPPSEASLQTQQIGRAKVTQLGMAPTVSPFFPGTVDQHAKDEQSDRPVCYCPIEEGPKIREQPRCVFPDNVHMTTSGKSRARTS